MGGKGCQLLYTPVAAQRQLNVMADQNGRSTVEKQETVQDRTEGKDSTKSVYRGHRKRIFQSYSCHLCAFSSTVRVGELDYWHVIDHVLFKGRPSCTRGQGT